MTPQEDVRPPPFSSSGKPLAARAVAHSNIALAKYWGKADVARNLPAVPSLSMTLNEFFTETEIVFEPELPRDLVFLDGEEASGRARDRVTRFLDQARREAGHSARARVTTHNNFPTAAGLASSASGFAALALAVDAALSQGRSTAELSAQARQASASAARSVFGGYVELLANAESASPLVPAEYFPLALLVAVTERGPKPVSSTEAMERTRQTSPYYSSWVAEAPSRFEHVRRGLLQRDLKELGTAMEESTLWMHASMISATPAVLFFAPATLGVIRSVHALREAGVPAYFTIDAGPHVKVLTYPEESNRVRRALGAVPGVVDVLVCSPGGTPRIERLDSPDQKGSS